MNIIKITKNNFDEAVENHKLLLVDFWAEWCGPCKYFTKVIEAVAKKYPEFTFGSVNIEEEKELADEFAIQSIPAVMILRNQVVVFAETGALTEKALMNLLDQAKTVEVDKD